MQQYFEITSTDVTVRKAILDGIVTRVLAESGIDKNNVVYLDRYNTAHQPDSTLGDTDNVEYQSTDRVYVSIQEERDELGRINRGVGLGNEVPFFFNADDQIRAWPIRTPYNVTLTLTKNSPAADELLRWTNRLNSLIDMGRYSLVTEAEATFQIPKPLLKLLNACWVASETRVPKYETYKDYLVAGFADTVTTTANVGGGQQTLAVRSSPTRIELVYDVSPPTWDKDDNHYEAVFSIRFMYQVPEEVCCSYPYIINQTPLPDEYFPNIDPPWMDNETGVVRSEPQKQFDGTWWDNEARYLIHLPYRLCQPEQLHRIHSPLADKLLRIFATDVAFGEENMDNPVLCTTADLPYVWNPVLLPYIEHCRIIDPTGMTGVFRMEVFESGLRIEPKFYHWDYEEFSLKRSVVVNKAYFMTESVMRDWRGMDLWPLQKYPKAAELLIKWLFPHWDVPDGWWDLPTLPPSVVDKITDLIDKDNLHGNRTLLTVANTTVIAIRGAEHVES